MNIIKQVWKSRRIILLFFIVAITSLLTINRILPVGPGNWNAKQIKRIQKSTPSQSFNFAVLGDNKDGYSTFNRILKNIDDNRYLFAFDNGDLVSDGEKTKYRVFFNTIKNEKTPFLVSLGNHDIQEGGRANYRKIFGKDYYSFSYGNSLFIALDNSNRYRFSKTQLNWAEKELQRNFTHKFVFLHVPPFNPRPSIDHAMKDRANAKLFMALVKKYKPEIVFSSHIHGYYSLKRDGVRYIITGGSGAELLTEDPANSFYNFVKVSITKNEIKTEVIRFPSPGESYFARIASAVWIYVSAFGVNHAMSLLIILGFILLAVDFYLEKREYRQNNA
jgi:3',5'-cyclic AMP phosphodiesterase CpdA